MSEKEYIERGETTLGIEFGSTRIKAVLIDLKGNVLAIGFHDWENSLIDGIWTYPLEEIHAGLRSCYSSLREEVKKKYESYIALLSGDTGERFIVSPHFAPPSEASPECPATVHGAPARQNVCPSRPAWCHIPATAHAAL